MGKYSMKYAEFENARDAYSYVIELIRDTGELIQARNEWTKEVLNSSVLIKNPRDRFIPIMDLNLPYIYQEMFDVFNENQPRIIGNSTQMEKTMGDKNNSFYWGNENRQGNSRWSLLKIRDVLRDDKNSRKAVITYGSRRPKVHYPCLIYSHFMIRDDKLHMTVETRGTAISMGWLNDIILFTTIQEMLLGWLKEFYPNLEMGDFLYKTVSMHYYCDKDGNPTWTQEFDKDYTYKYMPFNLTHKEWIQENGTLYHYVDECMKASKYEDIDNGTITTWKDLYKPTREYFKTEYYYKWALTLYWATMSKFTNVNINFLKLWNNGEKTGINQFKGPGISAS
jgi:thymidylate synthase